MKNVRLAIVYYSTYGTNHTMAQIASETAKEMGAEVRLLKVAETVPEHVVANTPAWQTQSEKMAHIPIASAEDMQWANAYLFSAPTRFGVMASQMRAFIDTLGGIWAKGELANKAASAMSSAQNAHGGQEVTLLSMYATMMHWGCIIVPPGYTDEVIFASGGNPYGASATASGEPFSDALRASVQHQTRRLVTYAAKIAQ